MAAVGDDSHALSRKHRSHHKAHVPPLLSAEAFVARPNTARVELASAGQGRWTVVEGAFLRRKDGIGDQRLRELPWLISGSIAAGCQNASKVVIGIETDLGCSSTYW